ncbi:uncharacterized protein LOC129608768 [Condylostylus longicornis]|uniref:uncharacterized protein LOC129608768 n=1 Tax=Condylostylus longicornis TaxID=2530218 RepID=UPI00244DF5E4|nr:uncharacterized protein LOC129608768 [Condylostylus longicornis]
MALAKPPPIENFELFLENNLKNGSKVISYTSKYLTKPGDNYGSCMLAVTANIKHSNGLNEILELVVKMPPTNELYWKIFEPQRTCLTENLVYNVLIPILKQIQLDAKITNNDDLLNVFPKCYGTRISLLSDTNIVDKNAILILENLVSLGYKVADRLESFDYKHTIIALRDLAKFHALPMSLRILKPKIFKENIMPYLRRFDITKNFGKDLNDKLIKNAKKDIESLKDFSSEAFMKKVDYFIDNSCKYMANTNECEDSLFTTIAHYDFWVNNMMFLYDKDENPVKIKILDFQIAQYESLAHDVIFFIFTSVKSELIQEQYDHFLKVYYDEFTKCLLLLGCDTSGYSFEKFMDEIKRIAPVQFFHIISMFKIIFIEKHGLPDDFSDMNENTLDNENAYSDKYFNKLKEFLKFYTKRGYLEC